MTQEEFYARLDSLMDDECGLRPKQRSCVYSSPAPLCPSLRFSALPGLKSVFHTRQSPLPMCTLPLNRFPSHPSPTD